MIKVNQFIQSLKPSSTLAINQKVKKLKIDGKTVFHFGFGQSPFPVHYSITNALKSYAKDNNYLPTNGLELLREEISVFLINHQGVSFNSNDIFIGPGSKELLYQTILILEGVFLIPKGSWVSYLPQIKSKNGSYEILETKLDNDFKLTAKVLEEYCKQNSDIQKTLILNSPNNPTGAVYSDEELKALAVICREYKVIVLSDEIYSQINFNESFSPSIAKYHPDLTIVFGGLSKVFSAGGYRLGFIALPKGLQELKNLYTSLFSETFSAVASPIQYAAVTAYMYQKSIQDYVKQSSDILKMISAYVYQNLTNIGISCTKPKGAFYMMIGFENFKKELKIIGIETSNQLADYLLENYDVALLPSTDFYFQKEELFFRLAFVDFNGEKALNAIKDFDGDTNKFIKNQCPSIYYGTKQIIKCVNDLQ